MNTQSISGMRGFWRLLGCVMLGVLMSGKLLDISAADVPKAGNKAPEFSLATLGGEPVRLSELTAKGNVALVVLRGWPGYQCPACEQQVRDFIKHASDFEAAKAQVVFVYPGPAAELKAHAREFQSSKGKEWPAQFIYLLDPDYSMVNAYGLRWDAPNETAYPSTFVIDKKGMVRFAKISRAHGDRAKASDIAKEAKEFLK
jgi:peroxiredoxin Q/BCP